MYNIVYETSPWHKRAALFDDNQRLLLLKYYEDSRRYIEGSIALGRVRKVVPGLSAAFIDIGDVADGFLPLKTMPKDAPRLTEGSKVLVRIVRAGLDGKGARLDARVAEKMPPASTPVPSLIRRAKGPLQRILTDAGDTPIQFWVPNDASYNEVLDIVPEAADRIHFLHEKNAPELLDKLDENLDAVTSPVFPLDNGGRIAIEPTAALTAIDLDSGAFYGIGQEDGVVTFNLSAVPEIARLIRLLDIGGNIITDFITMKHKRDRQKITNALEENFANTDLKKTEIFSMSRFGLVEMNREKTGPNRMTLLAEPAFVAGRILLQLLRQTAPYKQEIQLTVSPLVAEVLKPRLTSETCLAHFGQTVKLTAKEMPTIRWHVST